MSKDEYDSYAKSIDFEKHPLGQQGRIKEEMSKIRFEEDYIFRNCRSITSTPDIALTELVANAWDAGAMSVDIVLPTEGESYISVADDGCGMTDEEFMERWMTLSYNRAKHQGKEVEFPDDINVENKKRVAYGRNGVGRHGMLCFSDRYSVETWKNGTCMKYVICVASGDEPFSVLGKEASEKKGHGTIISAYVSRNKPNIENIKEILSARFVYDPQFKLVVNGEELTLSTNDDDVKHIEEYTEEGVHLSISIVDSTKTAHISKRHGVAFWVAGRLVGSPSWSYRKWQFLDARYKVAKRYTIIVQSEDIIDEVYPDWTEFYDTQKMEGVYAVVSRVINELVNDVMEAEVSELKRDVIDEKRRELETLSISEKREISGFMENITRKNPMIASEYLNASVEALMQIQKAQKGTELLSQLSAMSPEELDNLSDLLKAWDINDVINVIDEIDRRIVVIEAISRVYDKENTDELHTLHPLVLNSKWLFGAEFDSPMFVSNRTLNTVVKTLFNDGDYDLQAIANPRKRPDIVCLNHATMRFICTDKIDNDAGQVMKPDQILIIELKRGGFEIGPEEVSQAENYVRQIKKSSMLHRDSTIHAFVVGATIGDVDTHKSSDSGIVDIISYGSLVDTARIKLFGLKEKLEEHYNNMGEQTLVERALMEPSQMRIEDYYPKK